MLLLSSSRCCLPLGKHGETVVGAATSSTNHEERRCVFPSVFSPHLYLCFCRLVHGVATNDVDFGTPLLN